MADDDKTPAATPTAPEPSAPAAVASETTETTTDAAAAEQTPHRKRRLPGRVLPRGPVAIACLGVIVLAVLAVTPFAIIGGAWATRVDALHESVDELSLTLADAREQVDAAEIAFETAESDLELQHTIIIDKVEDKAQAQDYFDYYAEAGPWVKECVDEFDTFLIPSIASGRYTTSSLRNVGNSLKYYCNETRNYINENFDYEDEEIEANELRNDYEIPETDDDLAEVDEATEEDA